MASRILWKEHQKTEKVYIFQYFKQNKNIKNNINNKLYIYLSKLNLSDYIIHTRNKTKQQKKH